MIGPVRATRVYFKAIIGLFAGYDRATIGLF